MAFLGRVRFWNGEEGWGVIDSEVTPGGCWAFYTSLVVADYKSLRTGQQVRFTFEAVDQDGYSYRALEVWPANGSPIRTEHGASRPPSACNSNLTVTFHDEGEDEGEGEGSRP